MLNKIVKQEKKLLLALMLKNQIAEMWLTKKISETPEDIKEIDIDKEKDKELKDQYNKYIDYVGKLDNILKAREDNLFNFKYINKACKRIKKYI